MTDTIAIIGAGNLGSRHLQGLKDLATPARIYVIDPYEASLETCRKRWAETGAAQHHVSYTTSMPADLDITCAILSATADVRAKNTMEMLEKNVVKNILFEKVLFQKETDYTKIGELLKEKNISAWVNCPRRIWPAYQRLKTILGMNQVIHLHVSGYPWGMGCNSVHMLDLAAYLSDETDCKIECVNLDKETIPSKRHGFLEFTGRFSGSFSNGSTFSIEAFPQTDIPYTLTIKSSKASMIYHEDSSYYELYEDGSWNRYEAPLPYQSQMTGKIMDQILKTGTCGLTSFEDSVNLHLPLLAMFNNHLSSIRGERIDVCPIT